MSVISAPIEIPESFGEELAAVIAAKVLQKVGESIKAEDLPPYPTKKQVKQILRIGEERINEWIIEGLPQIPFGKETRFDREDIKRFLNNKKI